MPLPVPKSTTFEFDFMFLAKSDNKTESMPKQKKLSSCIILYPFYL